MDSKLKCVFDEVAPKDHEETLHVKEKHHTEPSPVKAVDVDHADHIDDDTQQAKVLLVLFLVSVIYYLSLVVCFFLSLFRRYRLVFIDLVSVVIIFSLTEA